MLAEDGKLQGIAIVCAFVDGSTSHEIQGDLSNLMRILGNVEYMKHDICAALDAVHAGGEDDDFCGV